MSKTLFFFISFTLLASLAANAADADRSNLEVQTLVVGYGQCSKVIVDAAKFNLFLKLGFATDAAAQQAALRQFDNERFSYLKNHGATDKAAQEASYVPLYADSSDYCDAFRRGQIAI